jgi:glucose/arabinose dehydrogenase
MPGGEREIVGMLFSEGYPGYLRGVGAAGDGEFVVTTGNGEVCRYWPAEQRNEVLASGFDQLYGIAQGPRGLIAFVELGGGRVLTIEGGEVAELAGGFDQPKGIAFGADSEIFVAEGSAGRVLKLTGSGVQTVLDGLDRPEGLAFRDGTLFIVDAGAKVLLAYTLDSGKLETLARGLPVGAPEGVVPVKPGPVGTFSGPAGPFAAVAAGPDGSLYVSGDAEGSILTLRPR